MPLLSFGAAADLFAIYSDTSAPEADAALAVAYGRVAAAGNEFAAGDDSPERLATLEQGLDARQKKTATELADKLLADLRKRREAMTAAPRVEKLKPAASGSDWNVNLAAYDDLRECAAKGISAAFLTSAGYGEAGEEGIAAQRDLVALADEVGMLLIGPNGQGVVSTPAHLCAQIVAPYPPAGRIGVDFARLADYTGHA